MQLPISLKYLINRGGTRSNLLICDLNQTIMVNIAGPGTNHWILGRQECARRIVDMVNKVSDI